MNADDLLQCADSKPVITDDQELLAKKERLYSLAACGKTKQFLGTEFSWEQIQLMSAQDIQKYHNRYESQLGSRMVRSLGHSAISLFVKLVSKFAPIDSEQDLSYDLSQDPILTKSLESFGCSLYYRFGTLLAPLTAGLITANHINFNSLKNERAGGDEEEGAGGGGEQYATNTTSNTTSNATSSTTSSVTSN